MFAVLAGLETVLVERKYGILFGGFGALHVIDTPAEALLLVAGAGFASALVMALFYIAMRALHRSRRDTPLFLFNFLFVALALGIGLLVAKYEVLRYFSDAIGPELMRNLGGGSLADALLFVMDDAGMALIGIAGAALAWLIGWRLLRRFAPDRIAVADLRWWHLLWLALPLPLIALAANHEPDARYALSRFEAYDLIVWALEEATDFDRDGYGWFTAKVDRWPFDPARHPLALDIPNNGIDEDGFGGDFRFDGVTDALPTPHLPAHPKNLVLIVLESTRADAIGRIVDGREVTPVLNKLAREGSYIRAAYSHVGFTTASLKSLFSGTLDPPMGTPSLFRDFKANGYRIAVFSGQPESFGDISETVGMKRNADVFVDAETLKDQRAFSFSAKGSLLIDGRKLLGEFDRHFARPQDRARPTFIYWNIQEAHFPYYHPGMPQILPGTPIPRSDIGIGQKAWTEHTYWNAVANADRLIGAMIERLKRTGVWGDTLLVVTADHGESLFDDNFLGHGHVINQQQTAIPLILSQPGIAADGPVGLSDYRRLLLRALGADVAPAGPHPVFHYIGGLDWPSSIGIVEADGHRTVMDIENEVVSFDGVERRYADLAAGTPARRRADRLLDEWARQRWLAALARRR